MIEEKYTPHAIESKWQKYWEDNKAFKTDIDAGKPKSYVLEMFPYPSGNLHMVEQMKAFIVKSYSKKGQDVVDIHSACL